jgi:hypothetical protein
VEQTLSVLNTAQVYKLPPRPSTAGWQCADWPKTNHIFTGRVMIVALGKQCTIKLIDPNTGTLFAQCPLDNDKPELSVEPVVDSSRYFVLRVSDGSGRSAFLGIGFLERSDAFEFNVTLQDHVKRLKNEVEAAKVASEPPPPAKDLSLSGSIKISVGGVGGSGSSKPRPAPAAGGGLIALGAPPGGLGAPPSGGRRRPVAGAPADAPAPAAAFGSDPFGGAFAPAPATAADPFGGAFGSAPGAFAPAPASAADPFGGAFGSAPFGSSTPTAPPAAPAFGADPFGSMAAFAPAPAAASGSALADLSAAFGDSKPFGDAPAAGSAGGWTNFG